MVCLSGGKDSYTMLDILLHAAQRAPVEFELVAVNLDQKQPDFPEHVLPDYLRASCGVPFHIENRTPTRSSSAWCRKARRLCSLCSRLRRGVLYRVADELGCTKIALGHHRDDMVATFFLNLFFRAKLRGMPPKLRVRRRQARGDPPAGLRARGRHRAYARGEAVPDHSVQPVRLAGEPAAQAGQAHAARVGARDIRAAWRASSRRWRP